MDMQLEKKTLREWRKEAGLTQIQLAELAGCSASLIREIEHGKASHNTPFGEQIGLALGLTPDQILRKLVTRETSIPEIWADDGYRDDAPCNTLRWWRERRAISQADLGRMSGIGQGQINAIERGRANGHRLRTRRKLAEALRVAPSKLILPGDDTRPRAEKSVEDVLRAELRGTRKALHKAYDFLRQDPNISLRALDDRDKILPSIERELKGV